MHDHFFLKDDVVHRKSNGKPVATGRVKNYPQTSVVCCGKQYVVRLHRVKFALVHGYLPDLVDHENRATSDFRSNNLRAATKSQNAVNSPRRKSSALPRGVRQVGNRFKAYINVGKKQTHLGSFSSATEAGKVAKAARIAAFGEFHSDN